MSPSFRRARPSWFVSARPAAQAPLRLRSAGVTGVDSPIVNAADFVSLTPRRARFPHTPRRSPAVSPRGFRAVSCPSFQGLSGTTDPLRPLEIVGSSVYRCDMRQSSSSRYPRTPPVPDRHAGDMRGFENRYAAGMRSDVSRQLSRRLRPRCSPTGYTAPSAFCPKRRRTVFRRTWLGYSIPDKRVTVLNHDIRQPMSILRDRDCLRGGAPIPPSRQPGPA